MSPQDICRRPHPQLLGQSVGFQSPGADFDQSGSVSPSLTMFLSKRWRVTFRRATRKPPLSKWLWVLKDAGLSHLSVPLFKVSWGQQPWETLVVPVDPLGRTGFCHPEPLANNARPERVLPTLREWLLPLGKLRRDRF